MDEGRDLRDIMRGGANRQQQDREVVDRGGDRLVERRRQYSGDSLELDDGSVSGYSVREVLKNSTPHPSSRGEGGLDPLSHNLLQKV